MRCEPCDGFGLMLVLRPDGGGRGLSLEPCQRCGGYAERSCCEGKPLGGGDAAEEAAFLRTEGCAG